MIDPNDELHERFEIVQQRLSAWHDTVIGLATEHGTNGSKGFRDPRLEAAMDAFAEAESVYQDEAMRVLGLELDDQEQEQMLADNFFVHLVVGVPEDGTGPRLNDAVAIVDSAAEVIAQRLFDAGYFVTEWGVSSGELEMGRGPEEGT